MILATMAYMFLSSPETVSEAVLSGLQVSASAILTSLFPFFVLSELWVRLGYAHRVGATLSPLIERLFHLPGNASSALLLGCIGGYPVGARTVAQLYETGQLSRRQAEQALLFCNNAGPAFVLGVMGAGVFRSVSAGLLLYGIHVFSALSIGVIFRPKEKVHSAIREAPSDEPFSQAVTTSIARGGETAIRVCTFVLFFSVLIGCLQSLLPDSFGISVLLGSLELAGGAKILSALPCSPSLRFALASLLLGWGGLCVMMQSLSLLQAVGLDGKNLFVGKLLHGILSAVLAYMFAPVLSLPVSCAGISASILPLLGQQWMIFCLFSIPLAVFLKKTTGK